MSRFADVDAEFDAFLKNFDSWQVLSASLLSADSSSMMSLSFRLGLGSCPVERCGSREHPRVHTCP